MREYVYTYRDPSGALKSNSLQANDRADALKQIRALGFLPVSVAEGHFKKPASNTLARWLNARTLGVAAFLIVLMAGMFFMRGTPKKPLPQSQKKEKAVQKVAPLPKKNPVVTAKVTPRTNESVTASLPVAEEIKPEPKAVKPVEVVVAPKQEKQPAEAKPEKVIDPPLKTVSEQLIAMLGRPGEITPPLPIAEGQDFEVDFERASGRLIEVTDTDDEKAIAHKANVAQVKEYIKEAKKMGWTPGEYLRELEKKRKEEAAMRSRAQEILAEVENASPAEVSAARKELNKELEKEGIIPLEAPAEE